MEDIASIVEQAAKNAKLEEESYAEKITECEEAIRVIQELKRNLSMEKKQCRLVASLGTKGAFAWNSLNEEYKWKKENVLAVFFSGTILPTAMKEEFWALNAPEPIRDDRDLLLARLSRDDFTEYYYGSNQITRVFEISSRLETTPFRIPQQFLADKELTATVVKQYPEILMQDVLPSKLLDDSDVFRAFVTSKRMKKVHGGAATRMGDLLSKFSLRIRGNAELMLEAAGTLQSTSSVFDHFAVNLADDRSFAIQLVNTADTIPDHALKRFSNRLRSEKGVVLKFVRKNGACLEDASKALRQNEKTVRAACESRALALRYCAPGQTRQRLMCDKTFMLNIFSRLRDWDDCEPKFFEMLPPSLKYDFDIVATSYKSKSLTIGDLPHELAGNPDFWKDMVTRDSSIWFDLPEDHKSDPSFACAITTFECPKLVHAIFNHLTDLCSNRNIWSAIVDSFEIDFDELIADLIREYAPEQIRLDRDLMLRACKYCAAVLDVISAEFQEDRKFVEAAVKGSLNALIYIPHVSQCLYPDLVVEAISNIGGEDEIDDEYVDFVAEELWANIEVAEAWLAAGGVVHNEFPETMRNSKEFGLLVAENLGLQSFVEHVSYTLRSDKEFMIQAVEKESSVFLGAAGGLKRDFDVAVAAFGAGAPRLANAYMQNAAGSDIVFMKELVRRAQHGLNAHNGFVKGLLCGMSVHAGSSCLLPMLEQGAETSLALKKRIAEYVGVPMGPKLQSLLGVVSNLEVFAGSGEYESDDDSEMSCNCVDCSFQRAL